MCDQKRQRACSVAFPLTPSRADANNRRAMNAGARCRVAALLFASVAIGCGSGGPSAVDAGDAAVEAPRGWRLTPVARRWWRRRWWQWRWRSECGRCRRRHNRCARLRCDRRRFDHRRTGARTSNAGTSIRQRGAGRNTPAPSCVTLIGACAIPACSCDGKVILGCHGYAQAVRVHVFLRRRGVVSGSFRSARQPLQSSGMRRRPVSAVVTARWVR